MENETTKPNPKPRIAYAERRVKPLARLLRCATALRVTAPHGCGSRRLVWPKGSLSARPTARSLTTRPIHPLSPREQRRPTPPRRREGLTVPKYLRLLPRFFQSLRCPLVGQAGLARRRRVQPLSGEEFSYGQDLDAGMLAPR